MPFWMGDISAQARAVVAEESDDTLVPPGVEVPLARFPGDLLYVEGVYVEASNKGGSPVEIRVYVETDAGRHLAGRAVVEPGTSFRDWLRWVVADLPHGARIRGVVVTASSPLGTRISYRVRLAALGR